VLGAASEDGTGRGWWLVTDKASSFLKKGIGEEEPGPLTTPQFSFVIFVQGDDPAMDSRCNGVLGKNWEY
jgi:hypothetical protein